MLFRVVVFKLVLPCYLHNLHQVYVPTQNAENKIGMDT